MTCGLVFDRISMSWSWSVLESDIQGNVLVSLGSVEPPNNFCKNPIKL
jgi:hypothetical protein